MKKQIISIHLKLLIALSSITSCASFSNKMIKKDVIQLTPKTLHHISGTYEIYPSKDYNHKGDIEIPTTKHNSSTIYNKLTLGNIKIDSLKNYKTVIKYLKNNNSIDCILLENDSIITKTQIALKLKKNGLAKLGKSRLSLRGVPFIFGSYTYTKSRIGLTKDSLLLLNNVYDSQGAILLILGGGVTFNSAYAYRRIK